MKGVPTNQTQRVTGPPIKGFELTICAPLDWCQAKSEQNEQSEKNDKVNGKDKVNKKDEVNKVSKTCPL